jgi:hypothetical protein
LEARRLEGLEAGRHNSSPVKFAALQFYELFNWVNIADSRQAWKPGGCKAWRQISLEAGKHNSSPVKSASLISNEIFNWVNIVDSS